MPTQDSLRTTEQLIYAEIIKTRAEIKDVNAKMDFILNELNSIREGLHIKSNPITKVAPCVGHNIASDEEEEALNKRMDIIAQNGNEGLHYEDHSWMDDYYDDYIKLQASGMFWEFHPDWTGVWLKDKYAFCHEQLMKKK